MHAEIYAEQGRMISGRIAESEAVLSVFWIFAEYNL